jgi:ABC-type Zn uptake system ZnuABC Zn-binding protein ZnuA
MSDSRTGARGQAQLALLAATGLILAATLAGGCGSSTEKYQGPTPAPGAIKVVTTTTFLADMVVQVGREHVSVTSLVPQGGDVHTFDPRPSTAWALSDARLVFANGLGLDDWLSQLAADVGTGAPIVRLGEGLAGVSYISEGGVVNPHLWLDVSYAALYAGRIASALEQADPANAEAYRSAGQAYASRLADLDGWARDQLAAIPAANRRIVSYHDALPYFCRAYGLEVVGTVVPAPGQDPSPQEVQALLDAIQANHVRAIFSESQFNPDLAHTLAAEAGVSVVSDLYTDTLGDPPANTLEGMIRWDVEQMVEALQ